MHRGTLGHCGRKGDPPFRSPDTELTTKWLRHGTHRSAKELEGPTTDWIERWNDDPKPFVWCKSAVEILVGYCSRISESGH